MSEIRSDIVEEALRVAEEAEREGLSPAARRGSDQAAGEGWLESGVQARVR
jgi:hypothetical protein